jgi:hypothetical protein
VLSVEKNNNISFEKSMLKNYKKAIWSKFTKGIRKYSLIEDGDKIAVDDFSFTVDGFHVNDYEKWKTIVYESMDYDRQNHKHYKHDVIDIQTVVLGINSGIVTVNYIWDYITNDDLHYNTPATVTTVYRFEDNNWRIVNSHVSHGENRLLKE